MKRTYLTETRPIWKCIFNLPARHAIVCHFKMRQCSSRKKDGFCVQFLSRTLVIRFNAIEWRKMSVDISQAAVSGITETTFGRNVYACTEDLTQRPFVWTLAIQFFKLLLRLHPLRARFRLQRVGGGASPWHDSTNLAFVTIQPAVISRLTWTNITQTQFRKK